MSAPLLEINTALQIQKPIAAVFEAIADPAQMCHYFISDSTGRLESGKTLIWKFPEFTMEIPVRVVNVVPPQYIAYYWADNGRDLLVEISLTIHENDSTLVRVTEKSRENDETGIKWLKGNTEGWANFLACLKAYLEYGINLRKGGFDFMINKL